MSLFLLAILAYFLGSFNGAQLIHHLFRMGYSRHITRIGTRNAGAQNIWINVGKKTGVLVFLVDFLKGATVIYIGVMFGLDGAALIVLGAFAILGHNWPIFFHFRGGRGFATLIGVFFAFNLWIVIIASLVSLPFGFFRYAGVTPFIFLLVGSVTFYSTFGMQIVGAYIFVAVVLYAKRIYAEWDALVKAKNKLKILKNLFIYDRATNKPPTLRELW